MVGAFDDVMDEAEADGVELSENIAKDFVRYFRGNVVGHEEEGLLMYFSLLTGWTYDDNCHNNVMGIGPPGSGKSLTKNTVENVFDDRDKYTKTSASGNAILDSIEWDLALVAPMDEYDKIDKPIIEVLKSSNSEDGGYSKDRNVEDSDARGGYSPTEVSAEANPWVLLYAPSSKKGGIDNELEDRALILYFSNSKHTRRGIGRKEFGHEDIGVESGDYEDDYIYDTHALAARLREHVRDFPIRTHYEEDDGEQYLSARSGDTLVYIPSWVWYAVEPIFNVDEDYTNRVYALINDVIKGSALANHENRPKRETEVYIDEDSTETETREAVVVGPQDVANILSCMPALLSTTHKLTPLKRHILDAVDKTEPMTNEDGTTVSKVQEWLEENDIPHPTRSTLKDRMDELSEDYYLSKWDSVAGPNGQADAYQRHSEGALQPPRIHNLQQHADGDGITLGADEAVNIDPDDPFDGTHDPIREQSFKQTTEDFEQQFSGEDVDGEEYMMEAMGGSSSNDDEDDEGDGERQASLGEIEGDGTEETDNSPSVSLDPTDGPSDPTEQWVFEHLHGADGMPINENMSVLHYLGVVGSAEFEEEKDFTATVVDPDHDLWDGRPDMKDDRVITQQDARRELKEAYESLRQKDLVCEDEDGGPTAMMALRVADEDSF
jgi:hypothetical protein